MKIQVNHLVKSYAGDIVLDDLSMEIVKGSKSAIVGENGSGKTTLLKVLGAGEHYQEGSVLIPKDMRVGIMRQVYPDFSASARSFILSAFPNYCLYAEKLKELELKMSDTKHPAPETIIGQYGQVLDQFERSGGYELENSLEAYAKGLNVFAVLDQSFNTLSGGQKTRIALVQLLLQDYEVLCLDEPTNHLDTQGIEWLERYCLASNKTLIIVSHDRQFLMNTVSVFHEIEDGQVTTYHGSYDQYRQQRHQRFLQRVKDFAQQQEDIKKLQLAIRRYRQWGHESDNEDFFKRAKALEKRLDRIERLPKPVEIRNQLPLKLNSTRLGSKDVVIAEQLVIGYDEPLTDALDFTIRRQEHFAIMAPNGQGKTTLLKTLMQEIKPLAGTIRFGPSVDVGYLPQVLIFDDPNERILAYIIRKCHLDEEKARAILARFGFYRWDVHKTLVNLSGGEQVRLKLLEIMIAGCNCLALDEPTNHLDIRSCEIIEDVLMQFTGTIIVISHDRMFLKRLHVRSFAM